MVKNWFFLMLLLSLSATGCFNEIDSKENSEEETTTYEPIVYTDYGLDVSNYTAQILTHTKINGVPIKDFVTYGDMDYFHTTDTTASITYSVKFCDVYGCWTEPKLCTISFPDLKYGNYQVDIFNLGEGCKIDRSFWGDSSKDIRGTVVSTRTEYTVKVYNSSAYGLSDLVINGVSLGRVSAYNSSKEMQTTNLTVNIKFKYKKVCVGTLCSFEKRSCTVSLDSLRLYTYFVHIYNNANSCTIK